MVAAVLAACSSSSPGTPIKPLVHSSPNRTVSTETSSPDAGAASTPTATPGSSQGTPSPAGTATPAPTATPSGGATATPTPTPTGSATATPTPTPTASQADAGGGNEVQASPTPTPAAVPPVPVVGTLAGKTSAGFQDADGINAAFTTPSALARQGSYLYVGDTGDDRLRRIDLGSSAHTVITLAGTGTSGSQNGIGQNASFDGIRGLAVDGGGIIYVADGGNALIRKVDAGDPNNAQVTTLAVTGALGSPLGLALTGSTLYVADGSAHMVRSVDLAAGGNPVSTYAGSGTSGTADGSGSTAQFTTPTGLALDNAGNLYVADAGSHSIRMVAAGTRAVTTLAGGGSGYADNASGTAARFNDPTGLALGADGNLYVADTGNHCIRKVSLADANHAVTTYLGSTTAGFLNDVSGVDARFQDPHDLVWFGSTLLIADGGNFQVRSAK